MKKPAALKKPAASKQQLPGKKLPAKQVLKKPSTPSRNTKMKALAESFENALPRESSDEADKSSSEQKAWSATQNELQRRHLEDREGRNFNEAHGPPRRNLSTDLEVEVLE